MAIYIRRPRGRSLRAMRPEAVASHPLWDREVNQSEFLHRAQDWTFARRVGEEWRPLTAHDAHLILTNPAADGAHSFAPKEQLERQVDLRLECAHRHPQVFATLTMSGMRSHLRTHDHPKAEPERTAFELFQGIVNLLLTTLAMGGILFAAAHSELSPRATGAAVRGPDSAGGDLLRLPQDRSHERGRRGGDALGAEHRGDGEGSSDPHLVGIIMYMSVLPRLNFCWR